MTPAPCKALMRHAYSTVDIARALGCTHAQANRMLLLMHAPKDDWGCYRWPRRRYDAILRKLNKKLEKLRQRKQHAVNRRGWNGWIASGKHASQNGAGGI